ncbi:MAG: radical SAM protein [Leptospiraceae bacterium]|nr:radical SAM protein [Leptospiraceae bacterium]
MNRPLKIALISPKGQLYRHKGGIFKKDLRAAPLTLTTLAALIPEGINSEVQIIDEGIEEIPDRIDADIIGMTVITGSSKRAYELSEKFRKEKKTVVLGGPHTTLLPEDARGKADTIVRGYAEKTWPQLLYDYTNGNLQKEYTMDSDFTLSDTKYLPFPRRDLLKKGGYKTIHTFEATRACIHNCEFCVVPTAWGRKPFFKPIEHVVEDIKRLGSKRALFYDLNIIANKEYAKELFRALIPLKIYWVGLSTTLIGKDEELIKLMHKSGCKGLLIGFESISESVLSQSNKTFNRPSGYRELIKKLHSLDIIINGTFVFGNDGDTTKSFSEIRDFILETKIGLPRFSIVTPFPGTPLFDRLKQEGRILHEDWDKYDGQHVVFQPKNMSVEELKVGHERIWKEVYSYVGIWKRITHNMNFLFPILAGSNLAYRFYAKNLSRFYNCQGGMV